VAIVWVNNDFGKGGRDVITREFARYGIKVAADLSTEAGQADFAADVGKIKAAAPDAVFIYLNEEESARILKELKRQSVTAPLIGETTLVGQKVVELSRRCRQRRARPCWADDRCPHRSHQGVP
jgi:branched-chain amino acid transport system substrate-binding protein